MKVVSVEHDARLAETARHLAWLSWVTLIHGDGVDAVRGQTASWDLIFADAEGGKLEGLDWTIDALRAGASC